MTMKQILRIFLTILVTTCGLAAASNDYSHLHGPNSAASRAAHSTRTPPTSSHLSDVSQSRPAAIQKAEIERNRQLNAVKLIATGNILINMFRPDETITWQMRLPRICWEACIRIIAQSAKKEPSNMYLLSLMLGFTALIDIFFWGPIFGAFTSFKSCSGGGWFSGRPKVCSKNYIKGLSGLLATFQSIFGGLFYLSTAVTMWNNFWAIQVEYKVDRQMTAFAEVLNRQGMLVEAPRKE